MGVQAFPVNNQKRRNTTASDMAGSGAAQGMNFPDKQTLAAPSARSRLQLWHGRHATLAAPTAIHFHLMDAKRFCPAQPARTTEFSVTVRPVRIECKNLLTSDLSRLLSFDSDCAEDSTCAEAEPASPAPRLTS
jgi:hypothetical protein